MIRSGTRRFGAVALGALLLSACHASASVAIRVHADGTGTVTVAVTLDRSARVALADASSASGSGAAGSVAAGSGASGSAASGSVAAGLPDVPLGDLRTHGWSVTAWRPTTSGGASVSLTKPFSGSAGLASVLAELDGRQGALRSARLSRSRSLLRDHDSVSLVADLRGLKVGVADDAQISSRLRAAGVDVAALDRGLQSRLGGAFDLSVDIVLPDGTRASVVVKPGSTREVSVARTSTHLGRLLALVIAAGAGLLGLLMLLAAAVNARRTRRL